MSSTQRATRSVRTSPAFRWWAKRYRRATRRLTGATTFHHGGYDIPIDLAELTGGGPQSWGHIADAHMAQYRAYCPIAADHRVVEVGCGVGRDAMALADGVLGPDGSYLGLDIVRPSIEWCQANITVRHPNFRFDWLDIASQLHAPDGAQVAADVILPVGDATADRIILQSVFTHMFEADITHYLREFTRILRPGGLVCASFFVLDEPSLRLARETHQELTFPVPWGDGCRVNDKKLPEFAVGYTEEALARMTDAAGLVLAQPVHRGFWCGRSGVSDGQDIAILELDASRSTPPSGDGS
jgi:ubiquinone/menaquinone biosynthesis C-methylase UbiE